MTRDDSTGVMIAACVGAVLTWPLAILLPPALLENSVGGQFWVLPSVVSALGYYWYRNARTRLRGEWERDDQEHRFSRMLDTLQDDEQVPPGASDRYLSGIHQDRRVTISWDTRLQESFGAIPWWEPVAKFEDPLERTKENQRYDLRIIVEVTDPRLDVLSGLTTANVIDAEEGFDGTIWEDEDLPCRPIFVGLDPNHDVNLGGEALTIGPGFRVTLMDGHCVLDSRSPANAYDAEHVAQAIEFVATFQETLVGMVEGAFDPNASIPTPLLTHLALQDESEAAVEALARIVFDRPECRSTQAALRALLARGSTPQLKGRLTEFMTKPETGAGLTRAILGCVSVEESDLVAALNNLPIEAGPPTQKEQFLLGRLAVLGTSQSAEAVGARMASQTKSRKTADWLSAYEKTRLAIAVRVGDEHAGGLAMSKSGRGELSTPMEPDSDSRLQALRETPDSSQGNAPVSPGEREG